MPLSAIPYAPKFSPISLESFTRTQLSSVLPNVHYTTHLAIHYRPDSFAADTIDDFAQDAEAATAHIRASLGFGLSGPEDIFLSDGFFLSPDAGVKGYTPSGDRMILLLYDGSGTRSERQYMIAHELTHQIAHDGLGQAASIMLSEGLAMYMQQQYMLDNGDISLDGFSRAELEQSSLLPISALSSGSIGFLGQLFYRRPYDEAGSFVQYLVDTYGMSAFERVYTSGDYTLTYGKPLMALEAEWIDYLRSDHAIGPFVHDGARYIHDIVDVQDAFKLLFLVLSNGHKVSRDAYGALDDARIAADHADFELAEDKLRQFNKLL